MPEGMVRIWGQRLDGHKNVWVEGIAKVSGSTVGPNAQCGFSCHRAAAEQPVRRICSEFR